MESLLIRTISSKTILKSSPLNEFGPNPELNTPGTFSQHIHLGRTAIPVRPRCSSAALISFTTRICSIKSPERAPARPARVPEATDRSWHGLPPQMMSTGGSFAPSSLVMSPTWIMSGNHFWVTRMGNGSISLAQTGTMPLRTAARGNPPMPSNKLPIVNLIFSFILPPPQ